MVGLSLLGLLAAQTTSPAEAYWTDTGTITSGTFTTWALTDVVCQPGAWGSNHELDWAVPAGTTSTVSLTVTPEPSVLSWWATSAPTSSTPLSGAYTQATWGITSISSSEGNFVGTWTLVAAAPGGVWTATQTGTWSINYASSPQTNTCTVNP